MEVRGSGALSSAPGSRSELHALLTLRLLPGVGDRTLLRLLRAQGTARRALSLPARAFREAAGSRAERARGEGSLEPRVRRVFEICERNEIRIVPIGDADYPPSLLALSDPPPVLFLRGPVLPRRDRSVAIVGSRRATPVGRRAAERIARELSEAGVTVVSGLALGIDGAAHRGALEGPGGTIAVLGCGPDRPYPPGNRTLFERILETGAIVTEFPPGEPARPYHFPQRNRIVAALARAVIVIEAQKKSGALITVDHALDLGLDVFAMPGSVETVQAQGTNALIRDGAHLLLHGRDVLEVMGWGQGLPLAPPTAKAHGLPDRSGTSAGSGRRASPILGALGPVPKTLDHLVETLRLPAAQILAALTRAELGGAARRVEEGWIDAGGTGEGPA